MATVTDDDGRVASFTVYVPLPPSGTASDETLSTTARVSSSAVVTATVSAGAEA